MRSAFTRFKMDNRTRLNNLAELTRDEKREIWCKRKGETLRNLAQVAGVTKSTLSVHLRRETMPVAQHARLTEYGVPAELLPAPLDRKTGPKPRCPKEAA